MVRSLEIVGHDPHHLPEPQGDDGQIIPPHPEYRKTGEKAEGRGHQAPGQQGRRKGQGEVAQRSPNGGDQEIEDLFRRGHSQQRRGVGPQGDEGVGPQVQLAAYPVDEIVGHRQRDENRHVVQQPHLVLVAEAVRRPEQHEQQDHGGEI